MLAGVLTAASECSENRHLTVSDSIMGRTHAAAASGMQLVKVHGCLPILNEAVPDRVMGLI